MKTRTLRLLALGLAATAPALAAVVTLPSDTGSGGYNCNNSANSYKINTTKGKVTISKSGITLTGGTLTADYLTQEVASAVVSSNSTGTTTCSNLTVDSTGANTAYGITRWIASPFNITNCNVNSDEQTRDGCEPGTGKVSGGTMKVKDDSVKLYKGGASCASTYVDQNGGGSALQFGWGSQSSGTSHSASGNTVKGSGYTNETWEPNRGWVGGMANTGKTLDGISVSTINIQSTNIGCAVYLVGNGGTVKNVNVSGSRIVGNFALGVDTKKKTRNGGTISSVSVNLPTK